MFYSRTFPTSMIPPGPLPPDRDLMEGLSNTPLLQDKISVPNPDEEQEDVCVKDYTYIGSYNWMKGDAPIILVPGLIKRSRLSFDFTELLRRVAASLVKSDTTFHHSA